MNQFQEIMYTELMDLVKDSDTFYFQDFELDGKTYRIFNYRLSSYTEFLRPSAMECRGHMFEVIGDDAVRLAAMPMQKFFNLNENPMTMDLDLRFVDTIENKADGSLISTYMHNGTLRLKSKGSLSSDQANAAMAWIARPENESFQLALLTLAGDECTVNLEWCAPDNRIVIGYETPHLRVLNARSHDSGYYVNREYLEALFSDHMIPRVDLNGLDVVEFVRNVPNMLDDIEGFVVRIGDLWFKTKTNKYMALHHTKDSINNPRRLYEAILDEGIDDLRAMFFEDKLAIKLMDEMQVRVDALYKNTVHIVETFYRDNKELDRKSYAIKGQAELDRLYFGLAMQKYIQKPVDYKEFLKSKYKEFGFKDEPVVELAEE